MHNILLKEHVDPDVKTMDLDLKKKADPDQNKPEWI